MIENIFNNINSYNSNRALCIEGEYYSYSKLSDEAFKIYNIIVNQHSEVSVFGISFFNDIYTYASVIAVWASGKSFVFLDCENNIEYNLKLIQKSQCTAILSSSSILYDSLDFNNQIEIISTFNLEIEVINPLIFEINTSKKSYSFFVENRLKGNDTINFKWLDIDIALKNLSSLNLKLNSNDRFLGFFNFPHPLSIMTFILCIQYGGCFYTTSVKINRAFTTYSMVDEYQISFSFTTPYAIKLLEPFFEDITLWSLKYMFIVGDFLNKEHVPNLLKCAPNAYIFHASFTPQIFGLLSAYEIEDFENIISHNHITSYGVPFKGFDVTVLDQNIEGSRLGDIGEFLITNKNIPFDPFFYNDSGLLDDFNDFELTETNNNNLFKTGIIGFINEKDMLMPITTKHQQIIVDGISVDLGLLEKQTKSIIKHNDVIAVLYKNIFGFEEIHLIVQNLSLESNTLYEELKLKVPAYMFPTQIHNFSSIPTDENCFIDYKTIFKILTEKEISF